METYSLAYENTNLTILMFACFLCSCTLKSNRETILPELAHAESLMYDQPDSALFILETMVMPAPSEELQNATWSLLLVQARDKNRMVHSSDSLINVAYDYFMQQVCSLNITVARMRRYKKVQQYRKIITFTPEEILWP